jgi:3,4-dihydroxy 2-butanone 4-phosphate synthase/GTP cyclohydrolase II
MELNSTEEIIAELRQGRMVIIMDDEDRENEGDLIVAAECTTPEAINFMAKYGRGLICLTLTKERCRQLRLPLMVNSDNQLESTNFTVSIEAAEGVTTGISAADRATTVQAAVKPEAQPQDLVQPGHIFPLMAQPGGVLVRAGHTEAGCDLARLAGFSPSAVIVEILNEDGTMARRPDLELFAQAHGLKIGTIADLIQYRIRNEKTVERVSSCSLPTQRGDFQLVAYQDVIGNEMHLALVKGEISPERPTLVRVHVQNTLCDLFESTRDCGWPLRRVMDQVSAAGEGVIVVLRNYDTARDIVHRIQDYKWHGVEDRIPERRQSQDDDLRTIGVGAQILADLGVRKMRVMSAPKHLHALAGFDLEVVEFVDTETAGAERTEEEH